MTVAKEMTIGFIGAGVMGRSMVTHLLNAGHSVVVHTRTKKKAEDLLALGAKWANSPKEIATVSNIILTMVGYPKDVKEIYFGEDGLIHNSQKGTYLADMTTSTPNLAQEIHNAATKRGLHALDAPVSGGDVGAREARLSIMVGGNKLDYEALLPIFNLLGTNIVYQGEAGAGQHTKMCNQIVIASGMIGVAEAMVYAKHSGLDPEMVLTSIETGAAGSWSLSNLAPRMIKGDFEPGFYIKHFIKDMGIALEEAERMGMETPGLALALELYKKLELRGEENSGTQALYKYWEE